jgi:predicted N-formylglutamate amidohydrolase
MSQPHTLLTERDPACFQVTRADARSPLLFTCDHAGNLIPERLGSLGISSAERLRHIAWDIGVAELGRLLSERLDATLITQTYSRLVIDVNRPPGTPESIVALSERTRIPGNEALTQEDIAQREQEVFRPYHERIRHELDLRQQAGRPVLLVSLHSFTPSYKDVARRWHMGVLYGRDARAAKPLLDELRKDAELVVGDNEPYSVSDDTDYTVVVHGERRGIPHVELEFRQDLIGDHAGCEAFAKRMAPLFEQLVARLFPA